MVVRKKTRKGNKKGGGLLVLAVLVFIMALGFFVSSRSSTPSQEKEASKSGGVISEIVPSIKEVLTGKKAQEPQKKVEEKQEPDAKKDKAKPKNEEIVKADNKQPEKSLPQYSGKIAVVIDDCGYDLGPVRELVRAGGNFSFAVLPFKANSKAALDIIKSSGNVAMLHLPMESISGASSESRYVQVGMSQGEIQAIVKAALDSLPGVSGVNNHQGSKATADYAAMKATLAVLKTRGLFFVDSRTNGDSLGEKLSSQMGIPTGKNSLFLDNSSSVSDIKKQIWQAAAMANRNGSVIVICHARPATAQAWNEAIKEVKSAGIRFVSVTELLN